MANRGPNVTVITEVGYCPFCARTRNLRREERLLGGLVRTTIDCESCHRTLSSTIGPPAAKPQPEAKPKPDLEQEEEPAAAAAAAEKPAKKTASKPRAAAASKRSSTSSTAKKPATRKKQTGS